MNSAVTRNVRLLSGLATRAALVDDILPAFENNTGITVDTLFEPTSVLVDLINDGERFDVLLGVSGTVEQLAEQGDVLVDSIRPVAQSGIGVAAADTMITRPLGTVDDFMKTLLGARSVAYSRSGASGIYFANLLDRLGIRAEVEANATVLDKGLTATALFDGRADLAIQQVSELLSVPGAIVIGSLPLEVQSFTTFCAGVSTNAVSLADASVLADALGSESAQIAYLSTGLIRPE
ncbi:ABC transporter substrate-binding protein [Diaminobutyricibacter tongyongensis]|uniref:ABC transporter substrate-binding protein n=1 Tax=Leifsonia tongyongensis TaxID=1268043 RepID=A0A6L9Y1Z4_9MICO|nr:substrate-binding domain-containing protein [Diaminobutyricibacter tongyongensis]NEN07680.1 ABC transporter substrate-binding protein [Diaminobutyricibacter tongyongensis]